MKYLGYTLLAAGAWFLVRRVFRSSSAGEAIKDPVEEASRGSFPASDAPAWTAR